jgi:hypothetical protein
MSMKRIIIAILILVLVLYPLAVSAGAPPKPFPQTYYGTVQWYGDPYVPAGTSITAWNNGRFVGFAQVFKCQGVSWYYMTAWAYQGNWIDFRVGRFPTAARAIFGMTPTATGGRVDLRAITSGSWVPGPNQPSTWSDWRCACLLK